MPWKPRPGSTPGRRPWAGREAVPYLIEGETGDWEVVIGLEVHAQIVSQAKLFSGAATGFGAEPNTQVSLVDAAMPGMLPVINATCVEQAVRTGLGLKAQVNLHSVFERKNYFYADLPQGYQISQYQQPLVGEGWVVLDLPDGSSREVGIERLHMEQDAGKSVHDRDPGRTFIDLNRSGIALMEIVSKPDLRSPEEAGLYLRKVRSIVRYLGTCDGNMEQGSMRCDVNVSVRKVGETDLRTRTETKNVNSVRFVMQAIAHEAERQVAAYESGGTVVQETRLFDPDRGETRAMRAKEFAHDYRYFPDPDLLPLDLTEDYVERIRAALPELPDEKKQRYITKFKLTPYHAAVIVIDKDIAEAFEETVYEDLERKLGREEADKLKDFIRYTNADIGSNADIESSPYVEEVRVSATSNVKLIIGEVFAYAKDTNENVADLIRRVDFKGLRKLLDEDVISGRIAKDVFLEMARTPHDKSVPDAAAIVEEKGFRQITDSGEIEAVIDKVIAENPNQVAKFRGGSEKVAGWFVGQVMKATGGKANPKLVGELLREKLKG